MSTSETLASPPAPLEPAPCSTAPIRRRGAGDALTAQELLARIQTLPVWPSWSPERQRITLYAARRLLAGLQERPGDGWQQRWVATGLEDVPDWLEQLRELGVHPGEQRTARQSAKQGLMGLMLVQAILPGYLFLGEFHSGRVFYPDARRVLAPATFAELTARAAELGMTEQTRAHALHALTRIMLHTGLDPAQIGVAEFDELHETTDDAHHRLRAGSVPAWDLLRGHSIPAELDHREHRRQGQRLTAELVDSYGVRPGPVRDVLVRYLDERRPGLDYKSFRNMVGHLVGAFWADIEAHHPEVTSLALPDDVADAWKQRLRYTRRGNVAPRLRRDYLQHLMQVRAFYLDIAEWAREDPTWAEHAVAPPIRRSETQGVAKQRHRRIAATHQRIRERLPRLPELVDAAAGHHRDRARLLDLARAVAFGAEFTYDGWDYRRIARQRPGAETNQPVSARVEQIATGEVHDLVAEEDEAFWAWAIVEVLRHSGLRLEELLELSHFSLVQHRLEDTGEIVPLLQVMPSKTDQERLLLIGPELASVLATIINRLRAVGGGAIPVIRRYDRHEQIYSPPLPHLFQRRVGHRHRVIAVSPVQGLLNRTLARAGLTDAVGEPLRFTPHDFRRIFATDAVTGGLPVHIAAYLLGHNRITSTEPYVAVFQDELISTYRSYLSERRALRPEAEYREPTADEWREFQQHFALRKVELGTCARPYGTPCRHEHACVRCPMLRVDPRQRDRLAEIAHNLRERIGEARTNGWHGEIEGLRISLRAAEAKLVALDKNASPTANLGMPDGLGSS